jgi:hypothetical protein
VSKTLSSGSMKEMNSAWYSSRRIAETHSDYKVLVEEGTDRILGAHILGSEAGEVINLLALAIRSGMGSTDLKHVRFAYPTATASMAECNAFNYARAIRRLRGAITRCDSGFLSPSAGPPCMRMSSQTGAGSPPGR